MNNSSTVALVTGALQWQCGGQSPFTSTALRHDRVCWAMADSDLFGVYFGDERISATSADVRCLSVVDASSRVGQTHTVVHFIHEPTQLLIDYHLCSYAGSYLFESWVEVVNQSAITHRITRLDSIALTLPSGAYEVMGYTGGWGREFEPVTQRMMGDIVFEVRSGRSSQGMHPYMTAWRDGRAAISVSVAWSGNWIIRMQERPDGHVNLSAGLNDWAYFSEVAPGARVVAPTVVTVAANHTDIDAIAGQYAQIGRAYWYPRTPLSDTLPVEWNHWWTYEDRTLNEEVFRQNVDVAQSLNIEVCTLDAGWFGPSDPDTHWYDYRGDWHLVNTRRFPSGIKTLSDYVHAKGMAFGIWCEIEALGEKAAAAREHPAIVAMRHDVPAGYVCLGSDDGYAWAFATLERLIVEYNADWIKLDFNLDPGAGCNRTDHGHGAGDGLLCHYHGYYRLLTEIRTKYPNVILENCSSGGLRIDLGLARHTHMAFLSDPDWPEHSLQLFWGATTMLAPDACLHWGFCEWGFADHPEQTFDPQSSALTPAQLDYYTRIGMLRRFGFSQGLPTLLPWVRDRYAQHIADYQKVVRPFVATATMHRLTNQPRRDGTLDRYAGFQFVMPGAMRMLLALFRLPGAKSQRRFYLYDIEATAQYRLTWLAENRHCILSGSELAAGWMVSDLTEPGSALILCERIEPAS